MYVRFLRFSLLATLLLLSQWLIGCGGGSGTTALPNNISDPTKATTLNYTSASGQTLAFTFPANCLNSPARVTFTGVAANALPVPITRNARSRDFSPNAGNTYIIAFKMTVAPTTITQFNVPISVSGTAVTSTSVPANTVLNIAYLQNEGQSTAIWTDVATFITGANGNLAQNLATTSLPGVQQPGTYIIYQPAQGSSTALANFGLALLADDTGTLQVINLYDSTGKPLSTPVLKGLAFSGASDLDGQALTPDGSFGILVDGGNTVRFFSGVQSGVPVASTASVNIGNYGGDGDSVAIMPNGDTAVVAGDSTQLVVISGIASGNPKPAALINCPSYRDGLVISNDGKTLLARGNSGVTVYAIQPISAQVGSLGGTVSYSFTQVTDLNISTPTGEDGRDGMAIDPLDSSKAVVVGVDSSYNPVLNLITGLPNNPVTRTTALHIPASSGSSSTSRSAVRRKRSTRSRLTLTGVSSPYAVAVTPDGKHAVVGTSAGLVLVSGIDTSNPTQVGTAYNPPVTVSNTYGGSTNNLGTIATLAITLDGKYVAAVNSNGSLLMYPITATGFGAQVSQLDGVGTSGNDQILLH